MLQLNIIYVFQYGFTTGIVRMFTAVPAHAVFAMMMGYFVGKAKFAYKAKLFNSTMALFSAAIFHGAYDYFWAISYTPGVWAGAVVSLILVFVLARKAIHLHDQSLNK